MSFAQLLSALFYVFICLVVSFLRPDKLANGLLSSNRREIIPIMPSPLGFFPSQAKLTPFPRSLEYAFELQFKDDFSKLRQRLESAVSVADGSDEAVLLVEDNIQNVNQFFHTVFTHFSITQHTDSDKLKLSNAIIWLIQSDHVKFRLPILSVREYVSLRLVQNRRTSKFSTSTSTTATSTLTNQSNESSNIDYISVLPQDIINIILPILGHSVMSCRLVNKNMHGVVHHWLPTQPAHVFEGLLGCRLTFICELMVCCFADHKLVGDLKKLILETDALEVYALALYLRVPERVRSFLIEQHQVDVIMAERMENCEVWKAVIPVMLDALKAPTTYDMLLSFLSRSKRSSKFKQS